MDSSEAPTTNSGTAAKSRSEMTEEEKRLLKEQKKAAKAAEKAAKAAKKKAAADAAAAALRESQRLTDGIEYLSISDEPTSNFGNYKVIQSKAQSGREFVALSELSLETHTIGEVVWLRTRVHRSVFTGQVAFLTLRKGLDTVQAVLSGSKELLKWGRKNLSPESIIDVQARLTIPEAGPVDKCSISNIELEIQKIYIVSKADNNLPLSVEDTARPILSNPASKSPEQHEADEAQPGENGEASNATGEEQQQQNGDKVGPRVTRDTRLDNRFVDLRAPAHASLMRLQSGVCQLFRQHLYGLGFMEIHSPKLIAGSSEGGSEVFKTDFFGREACLAQSPQLYKQMTICSDFERVFEIGPVFRAEKSSTHRHLCEFTGLDFEMEIFEHYNEILDVLDSLFTFIFRGLETTYGKQIQTVKTKWTYLTPFEYFRDGRPQLRLKWHDAIAMLRSDGVTIGDFEDLNTEKERQLGKLVKEKYNTDFFMLTHFPSSIRPFYTMVDPVDSNYSNSYDVFMRGEEIVSGAQRIHDVELLKVRAKAMLGEEGMDSIKDYVNAFKYGAAPHGGAGVGLERVVMLFLGIDNIRECSLFPRDPERLTP